MWTTLGREQKAAFGLLIVLGISGLFLGVIYFKNRVQISLATPSEGNQFAINDENSPIALQGKDTDHDGLTDYDEIYFYGTSPFIEDTDSDGYLDKEEIEGGEDPNCVRGKICAGAIIERENPKLELLTPIEEPVEPLDPMDEMKNLGTAELRVLLLGAGLPEDILGQISDNELNELYQSTIKQTEEQIQEE